MGDMSDGTGKDRSGKDPSKKVQGKLRRVRLIPAAHSSLFPDDRPLTAYLKPTDDPHIWKIVATRKREDTASSGKQKSSVASAASGASAESLSPAGELADSVLMSIIEATDLLLDEAPIQLKEQVFRTSHHALRLLLKVKQARTGAEQKKALDLLKQVLEDLQRLRGIADEEERFLSETESLDL
ncbi:MAG TPA: hypothetical protein DEA96_13465 [Leptospiraceae bacterium]|nr:hypothetical protein [Spirochaetaceae bacterium]HBS05971.1 hypothetical protein [Leptospiraceae bacterium]|tara:strand:+ start:15786 stop:16337 length:552 start_codon:yes stop_codon:yes gene_type:complete